jgi:5-methylcytosine-specific restriction endonuclease McrA
MRPVLKGTKATNGYQYDGDSTIDFTFRRKYVKLAQKFLNTKTPTVNQCTDFLVNLIKTSPATPDQAILKDGIDGQLETRYKTAALLLLARLGSYCSYCENIIATYLEVEHCVPKAPYPTFTVIWDNFLIGCGPCNQYKGNNPSRATVKGWNSTPRNPTEGDYYDAIRVSHYVWPDLDPSSFTDLPCELWYYSVSAADWQQVPSPGDTDLNNVILTTDLGARIINASIQLGQLSAGMRTREVQVRLRDNTTPRNGQMAIDLSRLNFIGNLANTNDRRLFGRTQAYFNATAFLKTLLDAIVNQPIFDLLWPSYLMLAKINGFYSVFLTLLNGRTDPSGTALDHKFVSESNTALYYPNTNPAQLP